MSEPEFQVGSYWPQVEWIEPEYAGQVVDWTDARFVIPQRYATAAVEREAPEPWPTLLSWMDRPVGTNVVLYGPIGSGKTNAAAALSRVLLTRGWSVAFAPVPELLEALRPSGGLQKPIEHYMEPDLLVLDDLGTEKGSEWVDERLYMIVNHRYLHMKPILATSNLEPAAIKTSLGQRTWDRLVGEGSLVLRMAGRNRRFPQ